MEFKQSSSIMFSNFNLVFKLLLYVLIVSLIFISLVSAVVIPVFKLITGAEAMGVLIERTKDHVFVFLQGDASIIDTYSVLKVDIVALIDTFLSSQGEIIGVSIGIFVLFLLYKFLISLSYMPISDMLNNFMSSNLRYGFLSNFTLNFRRSLKFALWNVLVMVPIDFLIALITGGLFIGLWQIIKLVSLPIIFTIAMFLFAIRQAFFAGWLPRLLFHPEEGVLEALKKSIKETRDFRKSLVATFAGVYFVFWALTGALAMPTFGVMLLISQPAIIVMIRIVELVSFYKINRMRFYTAANTVVDTVDVGLREEDQELHTADK